MLYVCVDPKTVCCVSANDEALMRLNEECRDVGCALYLYRGDQSDNTASA